VKKFLLIGACLSLTGCAGIIFSHKPYTLHGGTVIEASPRRVVTRFAPGDMYYTVTGEVALVTGDEVYNLCPDTIPAVGDKFKKVRLTWDKPRRCWQWQSR
jgi:hypothetical protein